MLRLRLVLISILLAALLTSNLALANPASIKVTIINNSGYPDNRIYLTFLGKGFSNPGAPPPDPDDGHYYHLDLTDKSDPLTFTACSTADNTVETCLDGKTYASGPYCRYWYTLDQIRDQEGYWFRFPHVNGGRLYISYDNPIYFRMNDNGTGLQEPTTDFRADDPNPRTIFDKFEVTFDWADPWLHANTTAVDYFAIPLKFMLKDAENIWGPLGFAASRSAVLQALKADPMYDSLNTEYRYLSPQDKVLYMTETAPYPLRHYFDAYVNYCWSLYPDSNPSSPLTITGTTQSGGAFTAYGLVNSSGDLVFTISGVAGETHTIKKPVSRDEGFDIDTVPCSFDVFRCGGVFQPSGDPATAAGQRDGYIKTQVSAALNRTVMHLPFSQWSDSARFYKQNGLPAANYRTNNYSRILHEIAIQHKIYAFAYDDASGWNSEIDRNATEIVLTIGGGSAFLPLDLLLGE